MTIRNGNTSENPEKRQENPEKRQAILQQAILTFAELGFRGTDVQRIADRAGVGKGTIYRYFGSKEDLFWATTYDVLLRLERAMDEATKNADGVCAKIRAVALAYATFFEAKPEYIEIFVQDRAEFRGSAPESHRQHHQRMIARFDEVLQHGIESGELRPIDPHQTTLTLGNLLFGSIVLGCHLAPISAVQMAKYAIDIFLNGIRATVSHDEGGIIASSCSIGSQNV